MAEVDGVFHFASWFYVGPGPGSVETAERVTVDGTRNGFEVVTGLEIPEAVCTGTIGVYDTNGDLVDEPYRSDDPTSGVDFRTKWEAH